MRRSNGAFGAFCLLCMLAVFGPRRSAAQVPLDLDRLYRAQDAAASRTAVLAIQQAISSLPPTSGQLFTYELDMETGVPRRSDRLGPTVLRSAETAGKGTFTLRGALSYFSLDQSFGPIVQKIESGPDAVFAAIGTALDAEVGVATMSLTYGLLEKLDAYLTVPLVASGTAARSLISINDRGGTVGSPTLNDLEQALATGSAEIQSFPLPGFDDGAHAGVGRINVGTRGLMFATSRYRVAGGCDFYFPSPNEEQFAGSASASILPRLIGSAKLTDRLRLYGDVGYEYDFDIRELRRFTWDAGMSLPLAALTMDIGMGGSHYAAPIRWTPDRVSLPGRPPLVVSALGPNEAGTNLVTFLAGLKFRVSDMVVLSGGVSLPVTDPGVQSMVAGTVAAEVYFSD